jgi:hypothetical protein
MRGPRVKLPPKPAPQERVDVSGLREPLEKRGLLPDDTVAAFCVGSVARGWANEGSDYDVYVVTERLFDGDVTIRTPVPLDPDVIPIHVMTDERRFEIKYWTDGQMQQMVDKVSRERFDRGGSIEPLIEVEQTCVERLLTCLPIVDDGWIAKIRSVVEDSAYREFTVVRSLAAAEKSVEDAVGALRSGDVYTAVLAAEIAFGRTVDALLESVGSYGATTPKWRARRMLDAQPAALSFEEFWTKTTMADLDPENPTPWVEQIIDWCRRIPMDIEI